MYVEAKNNLKKKTIGGEEGNNVKLVVNYIIFDKFLKF